MQIQWQNTRRLKNFRSEKQIQEILTTNFYQEAADEIKVEWWMQICKTLASDLWDKGEKIDRPDQDPTAEVVFRTREFQDD
jgi:hypothetical protein